MINFFYSKLKDPEPSKVLDAIAIFDIFQIKGGISIIKDIIDNHPNRLVKKAALKLLNKI